MRIIYDNIDNFTTDLSLNNFFSFDIHPYTKVVYFEGGENIINEGEIPTSLYYLIEGRAKLFLSHENGRVSLINFLNAGCFIGEIELIGAQTSSNGITAITPCTCYKIDTKNCKDKILNDVKFLRHISLFLGRKAINNTTNYSQNQSYPLNVRLAKFILLSSHNRYYKEKHTEAAEFLGVSYRHLLYVLAGFVKKEILQKTEYGYYINDVAALKEIAQG